ncbi:glycosyl hydrolase family protein [Dankookia rubra]|uniref:Glycosyl hydrolase family protein n=1 Tax=Dankookia rubra TaxID=1442381 RepID=A0A4R5Q9E0_9PROT|nr:family 16 glycosylhydrolase [Dankookia rubra]TDH59128.1 glycosyl hydrolase family protein [Dankookia rubra]
MSSYFSESFNNGVGALNHTWGNGIDTSVRGQVTVSGNSGIMENPWGSAAGHGYGTYSITLSMSGHAPGPAALLWPGNDKWPGPEYDLAEFIGGRPYGTMHFKGSDGNDVYGSIYYNGVDESKVHTYTLDWQPGRLTFSVDGKVYGGFSDNVGRDFDHGGINEVFSIMNRGGGTSITVYDLSYSPSGGGGGAVQAEVTTTGSSTANIDVLSADAVAQANADHGASQYEGLPGWMWPAEARWWDNG